MMTSGGIWTGNKKPVLFLLLKMFGKVVRTEIIIDKTNSVSIIRLTMLVCEGWK